MAVVIRPEVDEAGAYVANLLAPIFVHLGNRRAVQLVLQPDQLPEGYRLNFKPRIAELAVA
ncbi:MAG: flagellar assembly protein FliW [Myxococcales bacterium]|nr:flagellar assembly protein FliW [Myxococcales bacterium]